MTTLTQLNEFATTSDAEYEGYDAAYDGVQRRHNPHAEGSIAANRWFVGFDSAMREMDCDSSNGDDDDGGWTREDEESMNRGPDLPIRNDAGEYMY